MFIGSIGLTGDDCFDEYRYANPQTKVRVIETIDIIYKKIKPDGKRPTYSRPTLCMIGTEGSKLKDIADSTVVINKKYYEQAKLYLDELKADYRICPREIITTSGCTENLIGKEVDYGIEIVLSGRTLEYIDKQGKYPRKPKLEVLEEIRQSDFSLIINCGE